MAKNNNDIIASLGGTLAGYMLAKPSPAEQTRINRLVKFEKGYINRLKELKPPSIESKKIPFPIRKGYHDSIKLYGFALNRWACIAAASTIETFLKQKLKTGDFNELINTALQQKIISKADSHFLHGLRVDRNEFVHDLSQNITDENAKLLIHIAARVINKFV